MEESVAAQRQPEVGQCCKTFLAPILNPPPTPVHSQWSSLILSALLPLVFPQALPLAAHPQSPVLGQNHRHHPTEAAQCTAEMQFLLFRLYLKSVSGAAFFLTELGECSYICLNSQYSVPNNWFCRVSWLSQRKWIIGKVTSTGVGARES